LIIDVYPRRITGWRVSRAMRTDFMMDSLEQALYEGQLNGPGYRGGQLV